MTDRQMTAEVPSQASPSPFSGLVAFTVRALVVMIVVGIGLAAVLPDARDVARVLKRELQREETRIRLTGLLTTNPQVHMRVSHIKEKAGNIRGALDEIELALGLFDVQPSDRQARQRYEVRRQELTQKLQGR